MRVCVCVCVCISEVTIVFICNDSFSCANIRTGNISYEQMEKQKKKKKKKKRKKELPALTTSTVFIRAYINIETNIRVHTYEYLGYTCTCARILFYIFMHVPL